MTAAAACCADRGLAARRYPQLLAALSTEEPLLTACSSTASPATDWRNSFDLFLSALTAITGNLETAITASSRVLAVQGQVVPATNAEAPWVELENGERIEGESVGHALSDRGWAVFQNIRRPCPGPRSLANADLIVLGLEPLHLVAAQPSRS